MTIFSFTFTVTAAEIEGGRLTHIDLIKMIQKARLAFLKQYNMTEDNITSDIGFVIGQLNIRYIGAAREGDKLTISLNVTNIFEKKCTLLYDVRIESQNKTIAAASTDIIFVNIKSEKATNIPAEFIEIIRPKFDERPTAQMASKL